MRGTYRQTRRSSGYGLARFGVTGFGWIVWALAKISLTPRPMRIGLSGLMLWVGLPGVTLAQAAPSQNQNPTPSQGSIKDPFNPQGYMLEMAAKMREAKPSDAVLSETGILRSRSKSSKAVPLTPSTSKVTWLSGPNQTNTKTIAPDASGSDVKWFTPNGQVVRGSTPSQPIPDQMGWQPSRKQTTSGTLAPELGIGQTRWLTGTPPATEQAAPSEPVTGQTGWRPSSKPAPSRAMAPQPSIGHTKWLAPSPRASSPEPVQQPPTTAAPIPAAAPTPSAPVANQMTWSPPVDYAPPRSALPETPLKQMHWLEPAPKVTRQPVQAKPIADQTVVPPAATATRARSALPESPIRQARWLEPQAQTTPPSALPAATPTAQQPAATEPTVDQESWLAPENRAAQLALNKIRTRNSGSADDLLTMAPNGTLAATSPYDTMGGMPQTQRSLNLLTAQPGSRMFTRPGEAATPQTALLADDPTVYAAADLSQARHFYEQESRPWSLAVDLNQYRAHAVREGTRNSGESLGKALERIGLAIEDTTNVITLGYASERGEPLRANDGKGLLDVPERVPMQVGATAASLGSGLYSVVDLITFDGLPNGNESVYQDNHPIVRPLIFTGRTIGGVWKTTEEIGNAVTWGYFDNVTGSIGMVIEDLIEVLKHTGQAVTNLARLPVHLIAGEDHEEADQVLDWVLLVPLEFASNVVEMKGIANTGDYETAFADKGVIGSLLEFGGSTFIVYRAMDELIDELKDDDHRSRKSSGDSSSVEPEPEPEPDIPVDTTTPDGTWTDFVFTDDGVWVGTRTP